MAPGSAAEQFEETYGIPKRLPDSVKAVLPRKKFRKVNETYRNFVKDLSKAHRSDDGNPWGPGGDELLRTEPELCVLADLPLYPPEEMVKGLSVERACKVYARFYMILNRLLKDARVERDRCIKEEEELEEAATERRSKRPRIAPPVLPAPPAPLAPPAPPAPPLSPVPPTADDSGDESDQYESGSDSGSDSDDPSGPPSPDDPPLAHPAPPAPPTPPVQPELGSEAAAAPAQVELPAVPGVPEMALPPAAAKERTPTDLTPMQWKERFLTPVDKGEFGVRAAEVTPLLMGYFGVVKYGVKPLLTEMGCKVWGHKVGGVSKKGLQELEGQKRYLKLVDVIGA